MFRKKNLFFTALILILGLNFNLSYGNDSSIKSIEIPEKGSEKAYAYLEEDTDPDDLVETPINPDVKPSDFRIPNVVREYGMRFLEFAFYLKNSANSKYQLFLKKLKTIYYRV